MITTIVALGCLRLRCPGQPRVGLLPRLDALRTEVAARPAFAENRTLYLTHVS